jgi:predicted nucleic acid-binding protein
MKILLDTNVLLDIFITNNEQRYKNAKYILELAEKDSIQIYFSSITLCELYSNHKYNVFTKGHSKKVNEIKLKIIAFMQNFNFKCVNITEDVANIIKNNEVLHKLKPADASIVASALFSEVDSLYSNDKEILQTNDYFGEISIVKPPDAPLDLWHKNLNSPIKTDCHTPHV